MKFRTMVVRWAHSFSIWHVRPQDMRSLDLAISHFLDTESFKILGDDRQEGLKKLHQEILSALRDGTRF